MTSRQLVDFGRQSVCMFAGRHLQTSKGLNVDQPSTDIIKCQPMVGIWSRVARQTIQRLFQLKKFAPTLKNIYNLAGRTQDNGWWTANCHLWKFTFASTSVGLWSNLEKWLVNDTNSLKSLMFKHCFKRVEERMLSFKQYKDFDILLLYPKQSSAQNVFE